MPRTNFERLRVYQISEELADIVWSIVSRWEPFARDTVGKQLTRSADSIGANVAEGEGRGSYQDNRRFVKIARGSLQETQHWLRRAYKRHLLKDYEVQKLKPLLDKLAPTLNAYLRSIGSKSIQPTVKNSDELQKGQSTKDKGQMTNDKGQMTKDK